ncbi:MAG: dicarboxylate/amino acid:cation symporter [Opitutaceae bacterium]|nr:dicarboxylate/amino acid:cation symporter [Opitutaceae bacterium]
MTTHRNSSDRLATRIMIGLVIGVVLGLAVRQAIAWWPALGPRADWTMTEIFDPFGQVFLRLLFFVVVPLVFGSLALGVLQLGRLDRLGPLAVRTFALFGLNMAVGVALGLLLMNALQPGARIDADTRDRMIAEHAGDTARLQQTSNEQRERGFTFATAVEMFMPRNLLGAVVGKDLNRIGDVLPLIVFALLVGAAGTTLAESHRAGMQRALETLNELMVRIVHWALQLAPFAVAALLCSAVVKFGASFLGSLLLFAGGVLAVMAVHLFGTMSVLLKVFTRRPLGEFFSAVRVVLVTAFSTSSSSATLPTTIQVARERLGVSASTAGFVLPLGATMNMSGTALYEGCVVLFVAQVFGVDLSLGQQVTLLLLAVLSAVAVAGIPGGSLPLIMGLLATFHVPPEGIALVLGIDRILDMARTALNVGADVVTACIVDEATPPPKS